MSLTKHSRLVLYWTSLEVLHDRSHRVIIYGVVTFIENDQIYIAQVYIRMC